MTSSRPSSEDSKGFSLKDAFKRLSIRARSSSPACDAQGKPASRALPRPASYHKAATSASTAVSLPPYLAHLAASTSTAPRPRPFPEPRVSITAPAPAPYDHDIEPHRMPPRPPAFMSAAPEQQPSSHKSAPSRHPTSLTPANIHVDVQSKQPYPWELVPQLKARPDTSSAGRESSAPSGEVEKENRIPQSNSAQQTHAKTTQEPINPVTPPRAPGKLRQKSPSPSTPLGARTPNGSQRDPSCPPVRGQCWGIKQDGTRCTRKVRTPSHTNKLASAGTPNERSRYERGASAPPMLHQGASVGQPFVIGDSGSEDELGTAVARRQRLASPASKDAADDIDEVYCFQHVAEVNKTTGFYPGTRSSASDFVQFSDWFGTVELSEHAQALLRRAMSRPPTDFDRAEQGYIYIYELRDRSSATHLCLKVGRTVNVFRRLGQWRTRCYSKDPLLRAFHPSAHDQGMLSGADAVEAPGVVLSHRWETLVHLELDAVGKRVLEVCHDCGTRHREIFMIPRSPRLQHGQEQADGFEVVQRVVHKWMRFVQAIT
ncbi:hypothetical protein PANT_2d00025 [Moesziomyces antarcticus T-34]|uniref:Bacteriophage T5 Orf172 DNA-binding domain-containing protein n=1 Tax=Pseudozyma antarctica (strain T-34) TaxID=1151754 RepID=M9MBY5_PSEA3|nr:hypothetical protein PANT_2d00025 [Moesziomyces antarcticus T-34]